MRRFLTVLVVSVALASCVSTPLDEAATTSSSLVSPTTTAPSATTTTPDPESLHEQAILDQINELIARTEQIRELEFLTEPTVTLVDDDELADRVRQLIDENVEPDEIARDTALEELLGLIPEGTDLLTLYRDLYGEQVLGFYDGEMKELVVPGNEDELSPAQKATLVHELTHALTDQHFGFSDKADALDEAQRFDELSALQAITEGDATLTELHYVAALPPGQQQEVIAGSLNQDTSVFDSAPRFIQELLVFPYNAGFTLLNGLWSVSTGFDRINDAYINPPTTTEQVIHPDKYAVREPAVTVALPDTPIDGYEAVEESVWGELIFNVMFTQELGSGVADTAAAGWGGDRYRLLWNGESVAFVLSYAGDSEADAIELQKALGDYVASAMAVSRTHSDGSGVALTGDAYAFVSRVADHVLFVIADDPAIGAKLRSFFPDF
ncbi:MAG: hypothetical protein GWP04_09345 [Gammaproteobacteria bacterium]|nr:hypothetical protein [Gammaproteobacteria bacterium]